MFVYSVLVPFLVALCHPVLERKTGSPKISCRKKVALPAYMGVTALPLYDFGREQMMKSTGRQLARNAPRASGTC